MPFTCQNVRHDHYLINDIYSICSGWLQFHRQPEVFTDTDGSLYLSLTREDGQPFQQENETNC